MLSFAGRQAIVLSNMGFYSLFILPRLLEKSMSNPALQRIRKELLAHAKGDVLEIGMGSGLNLPEYSTHVTTITAVDTNPGFDPLLQVRITASIIPVTHVIAPAEKLPFPDGTFDCVVSTWTLCSIQDVDSALQEVRRVLKPNGKLLFAEHGLSDNPKTQRLQHFVTRFWKIYKGGCHLDRDIKLILTRNGFTFDDYHEFNIPGVKRITCRTYQGIAS